MLKSSMKFIARALMLVLVGLLVWAIYLSLKSPSNDGDWQTQFKVLPVVEMENDTIRIKNVRDFRYSADDSISQVRYLNQSYQLSEFKHAWFGISHFGGHGLAHVFMSFEFSDEKYLVVSIEARLEEEHVDGYSPIKGLFRGYNKTVVLATEQDVIGLRTHIRGEPVYLYKLEVPELYTKPLLLNFLREAQVLNREPTFYNTMIDNCMTGLLAQSDQFRSIFSWLDWRIMLPGNVDEIAYELGFVDTQKTFTGSRQAALVNPKTTEIENPDFSRNIRAN